MEEITVAGIKDEMTRAADFYNRRLVFCLRFDSAFKTLKFFSFESTRSFRFHEFDCKGTIPNVFPSGASSLISVPICGLIFPFSMRAITG